MQLFFNLVQICYSLNDLRNQDSKNKNIIIFSCLLIICKVNFLYIKIQCLYYNILYNNTYNHDYDI